MLYDQTILIVSIDKLNSGDKVHAKTHLIVSMIIEAIVIIYMKDNAECCD